MRLRTQVILLAIGVITALAAGSSSAAKETRLPPVKIDKNLRRALLRALSDLDEESAEQKSLAEARIITKPDVADAPALNKTSSDDDSKVSGPPRGTSIFSFDGFPNDDETPNEDNLQNTTFVEIDKIQGTETSFSKATTTEKPRDENTKKFQAHDVISSDKSSAIYEKSPEPVKDQLDVKITKSSSGSPINEIDSTYAKDQIKFPETLLASSSNGIATANALIAPRPTASSPKARNPSNSTVSVTSTSSVSSSLSSSSNATDKDAKKDGQVNIFQAPLVAAFTVQQDESGNPKTVLPIYNPNGNGQTLTLQEQLAFKQKLLEQQLAELQEQQIQQTQFLVRQRQIYEQQLLRKQQEEYYRQEQARLKQLREAEQARLKQLEDQRNYQLQLQQQQQIQLQQQQKQQQQQQQKQLQLQQQQNHAQQFSFNQQNSVHALQLPLTTQNVNFQPSLALEIPKQTPPLTFQTSFHDQLRSQQLQRQQQQQAQLQQQQQLQQQRQQQLLQQQRLQQSFAGLPVDFQPPASIPASRFHRQEAIGNVGNFGINDNLSQTTRNYLNSNQQFRGPQTFPYNPYQVQQQQFQQFQQNQQFRPYRPQTPAKQIQHLLYQSGVAGDFGKSRGTGSQEDLNIVSKVLALNVGALPANNNLRYKLNNFGNSGNVA